LADTNDSVINDVSKQLRVVKLEGARGKKPDVVIDLGDAIQQLKSMTNELYIKNYLTYQFFQTILILKLYLSETSTLFDDKQLS